MSTGDSRRVPVQAMLPIVCESAGPRRCSVSVRVMVRVRVGGGVGRVSRPWEVLAVSAILDPNPDGSLVRPRYAHGRGLRIGWA